MLRNYLTIAFRNFRRNPGYTFLNVFGLTIGIVATLFILLFITHETRYDKYHEKADRIYRISSDISEPDDSFRWAVTQMPLAPQLKIDYPEVEEYVRFIQNGRTQFTYNDRFFFEEDIYLVDSTVTDVFSFDFIKGDPKTALKEPLSIALSESAANRLFGDGAAIGETLKTQSDREYKVTGVYKDMPKHSHIIANGMISANSAPQWTNSTNWGGFNIYSYVLLKEGASAADFAAKLPEVITKYVAVIFDQFDIKIKYELLPLTSIHLDGSWEGEPEAVGEVGFLYIFGAVGLFMLLIAIINYMNLATARATKRSMEVGIRKVMGSERSQLIWQFLSESIIFTLVALGLSFLLVPLLLPLFNSAFDLSLTSDLIFSPNILIGAFAIILFAGILGGSYPAFYLSSFEPIKVLKGSLGKGSGNPNLRRSLVVVQFAITLFMLIGTGIIYDQMNYLRTKSLGFDKENVMIFQLDGRDSREKYPVLRDKLLQNPKVSSLATATTTPGSGYGKEVTAMETNDGRMEEYGVDYYGVDFDFFPVLGIKMAEGRNFSHDFATDTSNAVIVNEAMVKRLAWDKPIGKKVQFYNDSTKFHKVIGVVKDFHQNSLYEPITPLLFYVAPNNGLVHARIKPDNPQELSETIAFAERTWREVFPGVPFEFEFVDEAFMEAYEADQIRARIFTLFSVLMIFIACLGLLGLASFTTEQRTKEIGVRKVLGAETPDIIYLLTRNFVLLVALATIPAFIAAWYFMTKWLDTFTFHTDMNFWLYGLAFIVVVVITILTTGYFALRAAMRNPVESLKYE